MPIFVAGENFADPLCSIGDPKITENIHGCAGVGRSDTHFSITSPNGQARGGNTIVNGVELESLGSIIAEKIESEGIAIVSQLHRRTVQVSTASNDLQIR